MAVQATKAFLAGNKALAKELGGKGREQSELMKAAHAEASQAIYKHRNPTSGEPPCIHTLGLYMLLALRV